MTKIYVMCRIPKKKKKIIITACEKWPQTVFFL